jgi:actin-related protein
MEKNQLSPTTDDTEHMKDGQKLKELYCGIQQIILESLNSCDNDLQFNLSQNIVITGGKFMNKFVAKIDFFLYF